MWQGTHPIAISPEIGRNSYIVISPEIGRNSYIVISPEGGDAVATEAEKSPGRGQSGIWVLNYLIALATKGVPLFVC